MILILLLSNLALTVTISATDTCDESFYNYIVEDSLNVFGTKRNFEYYPWTDFERIEKEVKFVNIKQGNLKHICKNSLPTDVDEILLLDVKLEYIEPGSFEDSAVQNVVIQGNNITTIASRVFNDTNITSLVLCNNKIEKIEANAFENMFLLEAVALDDNKIRVWDSSWFENAQVLYEISFRRNFLEELPENTTRNVINKYKTFSSVSLYGSVNFDNNYIRQIHPLAFSNLDHFGSISLSNNRLMYLSENVFKGFGFLFSLYLNTNYFVCFTNNTMHSFKGVKRLYLARNNLNEECIFRLKNYFTEKTDLLFL